MTTRFDQSPSVEIASQKDVTHARFRHDAFAGQHPSSEDAPTIVVTGRRISDTRKALEDCIDRHCPPDQDIAAAITHAENQFVAGDYDESRRTMLDAIDRNRKFSKAYPVAMAGLYRGVGRVELHRGKPDAYRSAALDALDVLRRGLDRNDGRVLAQRIEVADALARSRNIEEAVAQYRRAASAAKDARRRDLVARATLRQAVLYTAAEEADPRFTSLAREAISAIRAFREPEFAPYAFAANYLGALIDERRGKPGALDAFLLAHRSEAVPSAVLTYAPKIEEFVAAKDQYRILGGMISVQPIVDPASGVAVRQSIGGVIGVADGPPPDLDQWIDVSFWILPDGHVGDVNLIRHSDRFASYWSKPVLQAIAGRRYLPLTLPADSQGMLRIERYTRTADRIGMGQRGPIAHFERLDLTVDPSAVAGAAGKPIAPAEPAG